MINPLAIQETMLAAALAAEKLQAAIQQSREELARELGKRAIEDIRSRTARGIDEDGRPFTAYSPGYALYKGSTNVNLQLSGLMLESLIYKSSGEGKGYVTVEATRHGSIDSKQLAILHQYGTAKMPRRAFLGWNEKEHMASAWHSLKNYFNSFISHYI